MTNSDRHSDGSEEEAGAVDAKGDAAGPVLCDGVSHIRLWALIEPQPQVPPGSFVRIENGFPFVVIDGTCTYWVAGGWSNEALARDRPLRKGKLSDAESVDLNDAVPVEAVTALSDCAPPPAGSYDYSTRAIHVESGAATCAAAGMRFDAAWASIATLAKALWDRGNAVSGPLHVSAAAAGSGLPSAPAPYPWPLSMPLGSFLLQGKDLSSPGVSTSVDDAAAASALRGLRDRYLLDRMSQPGLYTSWDGLLTTDGTTTAFVYMRDACPYEAANGLLQY